MTHFNRFIEHELKKNDFRVAVFGSARINEKDEIYKHVFKLAKEVAELGADIVTGGGPGLMEAASSGYKSAKTKGDSIGLNISLPHEQHHNRHLDVYQNFDTFSDRLDTFILLSNVVVVAPGGVGTCLEFFYIWQLMQVSHICKIPVIMIGDMWRALMAWVRKYPLEKGLLSSENLEGILCIDSVEEAIWIIKQAHKEFLEMGPNDCLNLQMYGKRLKINDKILEPMNIQGVNGNKDTTPLVKKESSGDNQSTSSKSP